MLSVQLVRAAHGSVLMVRRRSTVRFRNGALERKHKDATWPGWKPIGWRSCFSGCLRSSPVSYGCLCRIRAEILSHRPRRRNNAGRLARRDQPGAAFTRGKVTRPRRVYASFHTSLDNVFTIAAPITPRATADMLSELAAALPVMYNSASELRLIASAELGELARSIAIKLANEASAAINDRREIDTNNEIYNMRERLYKLMYSDLGQA